MAQCAAKNCTSRADKEHRAKGLTFHSFPHSNPRLLEKWLRKMNRDGENKKPWRPSSYQKLCSLHFTPDCFDRSGRNVRLRDRAVPTIFEESQPLQRPQKPEVVSERPARKVGRPRGGSTAAAATTYGLRRRSTNTVTNPMMYNTGLELMMECMDDALSPSQIEAARKAKEEYKKALKMIEDAKAEAARAAALSKAEAEKAAAEAAAIHAARAKSGGSTSPDIMIVGESPPRPGQKQASARSALAAAPKPISGPIAGASSQGRLPVPTPAATASGTGAVPQQMYRFYARGQSKGAESGQNFLRPAVPGLGQTPGKGSAAALAGSLGLPTIVSGTSGLGIKRPLNAPDDYMPTPVSKRPRGRVPSDSSTGSGSGNGNGGSWVPLDEYYYGKMEGDPTFSEEKAEFRFRCWMCTKMLYNNVKAMMHLQGHIDSEKQQNLDLSDLTQCKHCYKQFDTPFEMQTHIEKVHISNMNALMCRICEKDHESRNALTAHMRQSHCACEMPYTCQLCNFRSSMYSDVVDHFKKKHDGTDSLLCLYCLRVFHVKFVAQGWGQTQTFYHHLLRHQSKASNRKCTFCKLSFFNAQDMKQHRKAHHQPNQKGVIGVNTKHNTPDQVMIKVPEMGFSHKKSSGPKSLNAPTFSKVLEHRGLTLPLETAISYCFECKTLMNTVDHYKKYIQCSMCRFATSCSFAYASHMMGFHSGQASSLSRAVPGERPMAAPLYCLCGFSSRMGNQIANHLVFCSKRTGYLYKPEVPLADRFGQDETDPRRKPDASILDALGLIKKQSVVNPCADGEEGTATTINTDIPGEPTEARSDWNGDRAMKQEGFEDPSTELQSPDMDTSTHKEPTDTAMTISDTLLQNESHVDCSDTTFQDDSHIPHSEPASIDCSDSIQYGDSTVGQEPELGVGEEEEEAADKESGVDVPSSTAEDLTGGDMQESVEEAVFGQEQPDSRHPDTTDNIEDNTLTSYSEEQPDSRQPDTTDNVEDSTLTSHSQEQPDNRQPDMTDNIEDSTLTSHSEEQPDSRQPDTTDSIEDNSLTSYSEEQPDSRQPDTTGNIEDNTLTSHSEDAVSSSSHPTDTLSLDVDQQDTQDQPAHEESMDLDQEDHPIETPSFYSGQDEDQAEDVAEPEMSADIQGDFPEEVNEFPAQDEAEAVRKEDGEIAENTEQEDSSDKDRTPLDGETCTDQNDDLTMEEEQELLASGKDEDMGVEDKDMNLERDEGIDEGKVSIGDERDENMDVDVKDDHDAASEKDEVHLSANDINSAPENDQELFPEESDRPSSDVAESAAEVSAVENSGEDPEPSTDFTPQYFQESSEEFAQQDNEECLAEPDQVIPPEDEGEIVPEEPNVDEELTAEERDQELPEETSEEPGFHREDEDIIAEEHDQRIPENKEVDTEEHVESEEITTESDEKRLDATDEKSNNEEHNEDEEIAVEESEQKTAEEKDEETFEGHEDKELTTEETSETVPEETEEAASEHSKEQEVSGGSQDMPEKDTKSEEEPEKAAEDKAGEPDPGNRSSEQAPEDSSDHMPHSGGDGVSKDTADSQSPSVDVSRVVGSAESSQGPSQPGRPEEKESGTQEKARTENKDTDKTAAGAAATDKGNPKGGSNVPQTRPYHSSSDRDRQHSRDYRDRSYDRSRDFHSSHRDRDRDHRRDRDYRDRDYHDRHHHHDRYRDQRYDNQHGRYQQGGYGQRDRYYDHNRQGGRGGQNRHGHQDRNYYRGYY